MVNDVVVYIFVNEIDVQQIVKMFILMLNFIVHVEAQ